MDKIIEVLRLEHKAISDILDEVYKKGIDTKEGKELLFKVKNALISHLKKEDEGLYPELYKKAKLDLKIQSTLDKFANEMDKITKFAMDFFDKYSSESMDNQQDNFRKDYNKLLSSLTKRIIREENILFML